jgi:hypothetical protein
MRFLTLLAVLLAGSLVAPAWAGAATVSVADATPEGQHTTLLYEAGPGENKDVVINGTGPVSGITGWL